jgi:hypothetical protein
MGLDIEYSYSPRAGRSGDRIPGAVDILRTRPDRPRDPLILLQNEYRVSVPEIKRPGRGVDHPPTSIAEVKEKV